MITDGNLKYVHIQVEIKKKSQPKESWTDWRANYKLNKYYYYFLGT